MVTIITEEPSTLPFRNSRPYAPSLKPVTASHVAKLAFRLRSPDTEHAAAGKISLNLPTATCLSAALSSAICVFRYTCADKVARVSPAAMYTSSRGNTAPKATLGVTNVAGEFQPPLRDQSGSCCNATVPKEGRVDPFHSNDSDSICADAKSDRGSVPVHWPIPDEGSGRVHGILP